MSEIVRFSVSLEGELLEQFDRYCQEQHCATRSEAIRQLLREKLTHRDWEADEEEVAGTLTLVYDHHRPQLRDRLLEVQHEHTDMVVATLHAHLTHELCLEVIVLRGRAGLLRRVAAQITGLKGIYKGELVMASGAQHGQSHEHEHEHGHGHGHKHE